jgi:hypothetical protein
MDWFFTILLSILWGYICYGLAEQRGRDCILAFLLGMIFGVFAILWYIIIGEKRKP